MPAQDQTIWPRFCQCTHCGKLLQVSPKAYSVNCRFCNRRVNLENYVIDSDHLITNIETSGSVAVTPTGRVRARLRVENLKIEGQMHGSVTANGKVTIAPGAQLIGDVKAKRLEVNTPARLKGFFQIGD